MKRTSKNFYFSIVMMAAIVLISFSHAFSQTQEEDKPVHGIAEVSMLNYSHTGISDSYGTTTLFGAGIETKISGSFKINGLLRTGKSQAGSQSLGYTEIGATVKWASIGGNFGSDKMRVYGKLGPKYISLKESWDGGSMQGNSFGFGFGLGIEIPVGGSSVLFGEWDTNFVNINMYESNIDANNNIFSAGLKFEL